VFTHRLVLSTDARIRDRQAEEILSELLESVAVPVEFMDA
jgi:hypothetical protein